MKAETILVDNVASPDSPPRPVNREKFEVVRDAVLAVLPGAEPGFSYAELKAAVMPRLDVMFPGGDKLGWWLKCVQLDQEAKGVIVRHGKPLRWYRAT